VEVPKFSKFLEYIYLYIYIYISMMLKMMNLKKIHGIINIHWINPMDGDVFCKIKCLGKLISSKGH